MSGSYSIDNVLTIPMMDLLMALSSVTDLISSAVANHHRRVMYITNELAIELGLKMQDREDAVVAASLHDIGAFTAQEREDTLDFDIKHPQQHAYVGYRLLKEFVPFGRIAEIIRFHHVYWRNGEGRSIKGRNVRMNSHLVHLADRIDVAIDPGQYVLPQAQRVLTKIKIGKGSMFVPEYVEAFERLAGMEYFWLDIQSPMIENVIRKRCSLPVMELDLQDAVVLARQLSHIVDFKSSFTSTHTAGVASVAVALAEMMSFARSEVQLIEVAAYLHDLGKLAVPGEILEKPDKLNIEEFDVIRSHAYHTKRVLESIPGFEVVAEWAASHHEHVDGQGGYPFHALELPLGSRIIAAADVFTAITETRPYRKGMERTMVEDVMMSMVEQGKLDHNLVMLLLDHYQEIDERRSMVQRGVTHHYNDLTVQLAASS